MNKERLNPQNMKAMNLTVRDTELYKLMVLCTTAREWDLPDTWPHPSSTELDTKGQNTEHQDHNAYVL
jgi:hypothetical protein